MRAPLGIPGLFVTATDTGVGKTYITALIARALRAAGVRVGAYKPVCSGAERAADGSLVWNDVVTLTTAIGGEFDDVRVCPRRFAAPLAPPVAARREGAVIELDELCRAAEWWRGRVDVLLVEGVGGLLCPLTERETIADLASALGLPLLVVSRLGLGTINHSLLTIEAAQSRGLKVAGTLFNQAEPLAPASDVKDNPREVANRTNVPVLGFVAFGDSRVQSIEGLPIDVDWLRVIQDSCVPRA